MNFCTGDGLFFGDAGAVADAGNKTLFICSRNKTALVGMVDRCSKRDTSSGDNDLYFADAVEARPRRCRLYSNNADDVRMNHRTI